jgi:peptide/nickel transport system permease protein
MVIVFPSIWWGYSPSLIVVPFSEDPLGHLGMFFVPAMLVGMVSAGSSMRMTRTMMLEVLKQDYVRTAWAKGLGEAAVVARHAVKNALIPIVTIVGIQLPNMVAGTVIIERIFNLPGMGRMIMDAIVVRDLPLISGVLFLFSIGLVLINLMVDLVYCVLDPRIHYE